MLAGILRQGVRGRGPTALPGATYLSRFRALSVSFNTRRRPTPPARFELVWRRMGEGVRYSNPLVFSMT